MGWFTALSVTVELEQLCMTTPNKDVVIVTDLEQKAYLTLCFQPYATPHDFVTEEKPILTKLQWFGVEKLKPAGDWQQAAQAFC